MVQINGSEGEYQKDQNARQLIKNIFDLTFLPLREIMEELALLREDFEESGEQMRSMYSFITQASFKNIVWKPCYICAFKRLIRTNNDTEGYHRRLNSRYGDKPPLTR